MTKPGVLLHLCCAPCSTHCFQALSKNFEVSGYFYNPNIYPAAEYQLRLNEAKKIGFKLFEGESDNHIWDKLVKGLETEPEGGRRCEICFSMRLEKTARFAKDKNFEYFATTLTISPHKNAPIINRIGEELAQKCGLKFLATDFKQNDGFKKSLEYSKKMNLYRQNYCGCRYSG